MGAPVRKCQDVVVSGKKWESFCEDDVATCSRKIPYTKKQEKCATGSDDKAALAELNKLIAGICREAGELRDCSYRTEGTPRTGKSNQNEVVEICQTVAYEGTKVKSYRGQEGEIPFSNTVELCGEGKDEKSAGADFERQVAGKCGGILNCTYEKQGRATIERYVPWYSRMWSALSF